MEQEKDEWAWEEEGKDKPQGVPEERRNPINNGEREMQEKKIMQACMAKLDEESLRQNFVPFLSASTSCKTEGGGPQVVEVGRLEGIIGKKNIEDEPDGEGGHEEEGPGHGEEEEGQEEKASGREEEEKLEERAGSDQEEGKGEEGEVMDDAKGEEKREGNGGECVKNAEDEGEGSAEGRGM
jgi:hypothetical protein